MIPRLLSHALTGIAVAYAACWLVAVALWHPGVRDEEDDPRGPEQDDERAGDGLVEQYVASLNVPAGNTLGRRERPSR